MTSSGLIAKVDDSFYPYHSIKDAYELAVANRDKAVTEMPASPMGGEAHLIKTNLVNDKVMLVDMTGLWTTRTHGVKYYCPITFQAYDLVDGKLAKNCKTKDRRYQLLPVEEDILTKDMALQIRSNIGRICDEQSKLTFGRRALRWAHITLASWH